MTLLTTSRTVADVAAEAGVSSRTLYQWQKTHGAAVARELGLPLRAAMDPDTSTLVSSHRPENGQLFGASFGETAESARSEAERSMLESALRKALRERDALRVVFDMLIDETRKTPPYQ
jgi:hypothetical protein